MPELPEAETIRRQLAERLPGRRIQRVTVNLARAVREHASAQEFISLVQGRTITEVARRGKAVVLLLDGKRLVMLICRLGMSGNLLLAQPREPLAKHTHVILHMSANQELRFVDTRQFGMMVAREGHDLDSFPEFAGYGPDALSQEFTAQYLYGALKRRTTKLEAALMDQKLVAGIGKIYSDEVCFRAGLRPGQPGSRLTRPKCERLHAAIREVLEDAIAHGGTSDEDEAYVDALGNPGAFRERLAVYRREGQPCRVCGTPIKRAPLQGRGMHWCPQCQK